MGDRGDTGTLVAGVIAVVAVACCALGPAAVVGALGTLTGGVVVGAVSLVVVAVVLGVRAVIERRRLAARSAPPAD
jgi:hypothetical protein